MPWRQVLVALLCTSLTVRSSPCSWVEVLSSWSQGYKAVVKLQVEETVDHWDVDVEFSESVINFEAWKGHVNKISDTSFAVSNTCYNNMVYSCQCFELPYLVRHEPMWVGNTTFKFNGVLVPACDPPSCDDSSSSGDANTTTGNSTTTELTNVEDEVDNMLNDLNNLLGKRSKRQSNDFTKDQNDLLKTMDEYTTYLKEECSLESGNCKSKTIAEYGSKLKAIFNKVKSSGKITSAFVNAFKDKVSALKKATDEAVKAKGCKANGKPCIFPFKDDAGREHNSCADYKGRYFWCATRVNSKGKYTSWEKCPEDGSCQATKLPPTTTTTSTTTTTTTTTTTPKSKPCMECKAGSKPCVFPFTDTDGTEYNECADYKGRYMWCATAVNSKGTFTKWAKCTECKECTSTPEVAGESCVAINKKPCIFPFKDDDGVSNNGCANYKGQYYWCATSLKSNGVYHVWERCSEDCPHHDPSKLPPDPTKATSTVAVTPASSTLSKTSSSPAMSTTLSLEKESASTTFTIKDGDKFFSCKVDFIFESMTGFKMESNFSSTCSSASSKEDHYKNFDKHYFDITTESGALINCQINIIIQDEESGVGLATKPMEKSLECSVDESECVTISGESFPTPCVLPFIHDGRKYQACTDKGGKEEGNTWCATAVDGSLEMISWGYCSSACGYCGGKDVSNGDTRSIKECGYDCFINPYKKMEPNTAGMDPKLLSAPEVYVKKTMPQWNKKGNGQYRFLKGDPGIFLSCSNGFDRFPCHQTIYINCTGNYRFNVYSAEINDNDNIATIGGRVKTDVKNVHIGCGACPLGFGYKLGDEKPTTDNNRGTFTVTDIGVCGDLCQKEKSCNTFVFSAKEKYCELNAKRVETPSYQKQYRDYRLCTKEEDDTCSSGCCSSCSVSNKQKKFQSMLMLRSPPGPAAGQPLDLYHAENHGLFIIKMFQQLHLSTNILLPPPYPPGVQMPRFHYMPPNRPGPHYNLPVTAHNDPFINLQPYSAVYLFFLGPRTNAIQGNGGPLAPGAVNNMNTIWTNILNNNPNLANQNGMLSSATEDVFPFYVGHTDNLCRRYREHANVHNDLSKRRWRDGRNMLPAGSRGRNFHLYFTYAVTDSITKAMILEKMFLDTFDFPSNIRDNDMSRIPVFQQNPNTLNPALYNKFEYVKDVINRDFLGAIDQTLDFFHPGGILPPLPPPPTPIQNYHRNTILL